MLLSPGSDDYNRTGTGARRITALIAYDILDYHLFMSEDNTIIVTAAIIVDEGKVLIAQRPRGGRHPGQWEFPGGKVEPGETARECVVRELCEELGVVVRAGRQAAAIRHSYPDLEIQLVALECEITGGELSDIECSAHAWVQPDELAGFEMLPPDRVLAAKLFGAGFRV